MFLYLMSPSRKTKTLAPPPLGLGQGGGVTHNAILCSFVLNRATPWCTDLLFDGEVLLGCHYRDVCGDMDEVNGC